MRATESLTARNTYCSKQAFLAGPLCHRRMTQWRAYSFRIQETERYVDVVLIVNMDTLILLLFKFYCLIYIYIKGQTDHRKIKHILDRI